MKNIDFVRVNELDLPVDYLVERLNNLTESWIFSPKAITVNATPPLTKPGTFKAFTQAYLEKFGKAYLQKDLIVYLTDAPFRNGFFYDEMFEEAKRITIISLANWNEYTTLPPVNGALHFFNMTIAEHIDDSFRHYQNTGCIYDFLTDKRGVENAMKKGEICETCRNRILAKAKTADRVLALKNLNTILRELSTASSAEMSIVDHWQSSITVAKAKRSELNFRNEIMREDLRAIRKHLEKLDLNSAFSLLTTFADAHCPQFSNEVQLLKLRWASLAKRERMGILDHHTSNRERNTLLHNALNLLTEIEQAAGESGVH
jgi:hypothetical protein